MQRALLAALRYIKKILKVCAPMGLPNTLFFAERAEDISTFYEPPLEWKGRNDEVGNGLLELFWIKVRAMDHDSQGWHYLVRASGCDTVYSSRRRRIGSRPPFDQQRNIPPRHR